MQLVHYKEAHLCSGNSSTCLHGKNQETNCKNNLYYCLDISAKFSQAEFFAPRVVRQLN